ncbi:hypothetical protein PENTCL1PPCAC_17615, partial [Pristionchus entomophagus]
QGLIRSTSSVSVTSSCPFNFDNVPFDFNDCYLCVSLIGIVAQFNLSTQSLRVYPPTEYSVWKNYSTDPFSLFQNGLP